MTERYRAVPKIDHETSVVTEAIKPKPDHIGQEVGLVGPLVYVVVRHDGKMVGLEPTRHAAVGLAVTLHSCDDYTIQPMPTGMVRYEDVAANAEVDL